MAGIFKANNPFNTFLLFVYGLILKFCWFRNPIEPGINKFDGLLYKAAFPYIHSLWAWSPFFFLTIVYLFIFTQAVIFNRLLSTQRLFQKANYLPGMSYLLISSFVPEWNQFSSVLIVNTLMIWSYSKMNKLYNNQDPKENLFNLGMIISFCSFLYVPSVLFLLLLFFSLAITRTFRIREWTVCILGLITPYYFLLISIFLHDNNIKRFKFPILYPRLVNFHISLIQIVFYSFVVLIALIGVFFINNNLKKQVVHVRKSWAIILVYLFIAAIIGVFYSNNEKTYLYLVLVPFSTYIAAYYFYLRSRMMLTITHIIMIAFIVYNGFFIK